MHDRKGAVSLSPIHAGYAVDPAYHHPRPAAEGTRAEEQAESRAKEASEEDSKVPDSSASSGGHVDTYA
jgi:hypothetical protein